MRVFSLPQSFWRDLRISLAFLTSSGSKIPLLTRNCLNASSSIGPAFRRDIPIATSLLFCICANSCAWDSPEPVKGRSIGGRPSNALAPFILRRLLLRLSSISLMICMVLSGTISSMVRTRSAVGAATGVVTASATTGLVADTSTDGNVVGNRVRCPPVIAGKNSGVYPSIPSST